MELTFYDCKHFGNIQREYFCEGIKIIITSKLYVGKNCMFIERYNETKYRVQKPATSFAIDYEDFETKLQYGHFDSVKSLAVNTYFSSDDLDVLKIANEFAKRGIKTRIVCEEPKNIDTEKFSRISKIKF